MAEADTTQLNVRDHGGGLDAAIAQYGGTRSDWLDLSTGINPNPYPLGPLDQDAWTALPDQHATKRLTDAAREFWQVPDSAEIIAAPGASALIARLPQMIAAGPIGKCRVQIETPTYNEHAAAFHAQGFEVVGDAPSDAPVHVHVHPNNPDGRLASLGSASLNIIDESFCDAFPTQSLIERTAQPSTVILKSFGKFWGLAGLRLGFAIAHPATFSEGISLRELLGPWPVAGPALEIGARALSDKAWANQTRKRLTRDAKRLDSLIASAHGAVVGGTPLFRLYETKNALAIQDRLARAHIWSRAFPYSQNWLRLGLPDEPRWTQLEEALR